MSKRPVLVCIGGGSASGKSTLSRGLMAQLQDHSAGLINLDNYFRDWSVDDDIRTANRPDAVLWPALVADLDRIDGGESIELPVKGTRAYARGMETQSITARDVIVVEGLLALWEDTVRARTDLAVYVDAPDDERLMRRIQRDIRERGATVDSAIAWYRHDVKPSFHRYTEPTKWRADLVIPNVGDGGPSAASLSALVAAVRALLRK